MSDDIIVTHQRQRISLRALFGTKDDATASRPTTLLEDGASQGNADVVILSIQGFCRPNAAIEIKNTTHLPAVIAHVQAYSEFKTLTVS